MRMFEQARAGKLDGSYEMHWRTRDGGTRRIAWTASSLNDPQGDINFVITTGVDVTEQRHELDRLRTSEARYRQLVEGSLGIICTHDLDGNIQSINSHAAAILGHTPEEIVGTPLFDYIADDHKRDYEQYVSALNEQHEHPGVVLSEAAERAVGRCRLSQQAAATPRHRADRAQAMASTLRNRPTPRRSCTR